MGWDIVVREAGRQVHSDGLHFEGSTYYHVYAIDFLIHAALLAKLNGITIPRSFAETLERMLRVLSLLGRAGQPPRFGDDDGGRLFDGQRNRSEHLLDPLAAGAVLFCRGDFKALADGLREETVWLLGAAGAEDYDCLKSRAPGWESATLPKSGLHLLSASEGRSQLAIIAGRIIGHSIGHAHADALSICLQHSGQTLLMDPGTFEYVGESNTRELYRSTEMHSTLRVEEASQAEPFGPFSWKRMALSTVEQWIQGETFTLFCGSHDGYSLHSPPVVHRRWVVALNSGLFLVRDVAEGRGETRLNISWHLGPLLKKEQNHLFRVTGSSRGLIILPVEGHGWSEDSFEDRWSPVYGVERPANSLNFSVTTKLPADFATLLLPLEELSHSPGTFMHLTRDSASGVKAYSYKDQSHEHLFFFSQQKPWRCLSVESDASFLYCKRNDVGKSEILGFCDGSFVEISAQRVLSTSRRVSRCELVIGPDGPAVFSSDPDSVQPRPTPAPI